MLIFKNMILIGSTGRNTGKTEFACSIIKHFKNKYNFIGLKATTIANKNESCPRGGEGCGVCTSLTGSYKVTEEKNISGNKDTSRLLIAGAKKVFWLQVFKHQLEIGFNAFLHILKTKYNLTKDRYIFICESNSLRTILEPGIFIIINNNSDLSFKPTANAVKNYADRIINSKLIIKNHIKDIKIINNECILS